MKKNVNVQQALDFLVEHFVLKVRLSVSSFYDVTDGSDNEKYAGLCNIAVNRLIEEVYYYAEERNIDITCTRIHGEQKHTPKLDSSYWGARHTWAVIRFHNRHIYVDPTSGQFQHIYRDIPDYYISDKPPKWFYPDSRNIAFSSIGKSINTRFKVKYKTHITVGPRSCDYKMTSGIIEFIQYEIWGRISDCIRRVILKRA